MKNRLKEFGIALLVLVMLSATHKTDNELEGKWKVVDIRRNTCENVEHNGIKTHSCPERCMTFDFNNGMVEQVYTDPEGGEIKMSFVYTVGANKIILCGNGESKEICDEITYSFENNLLILTTLEEDTDCEVITTLVR